VRHRFAEERAMILASLFGMSLIVNVSLDPRPPALADPAIETQLSVRQKDAALDPHIRGATACIARAVTQNPRFSETIRRDQLNDLIVDAMAGCERTLRAMIRIHDRMYGQGSGEAFLLGGYLEVLPAAIFRQARVRSAQ
jgi:hypothetical protein